jgi:uncharacterized heparinase superfamily protein
MPTAFRWPASMTAIRNCPAPRFIGATFHFQPGRIAINDHVHGKVDCDGRIAFLLHPDISAERESHHSWRLRGGTEEAIIRSDQAIDIEEAIWWPGLGTEMPTRRLVIRLTADRLRDPIGTELIWQS